MPCFALKLIVNITDILYKSPIIFLKNYCLLSGNYYVHRLACVINNNTVDSIISFAMF
jgi:hypothetical protein